MKTTTITCDVCGKVKGESNHWFKVEIRSQCIFVTPASWARNTKEQDACGQECVHKLLDRWMESQTHD